MSSRAFNIVKNKSYDRILELAKDDTASGVRDSGGLIDNRLFTGGNRLHAIMDPQTTFWRVQYDAGLPPSPLRQQFTSFSRLLSFVEDYYKKRNIKITKVID